MAYREPLATEKQRSFILDLLEKRDITVGEVHRPRDDHGGVAPGGRSAVRALSGAEHVRDDVRNTAVRHLVGRQVGQPLGEEPGYVHVERGGSAENLRIASPAQALVALRAVGGHVEEIPFLSPGDVVLELVEHRVRCFERSGDPHV